MKQVLLIFIFFIASISISAQLNFDFTASVTEGCGSLSNVQFTPTGDASITSWSWRFGNRNVSTLKNPSASYPATGTYSVTLIVSNGTTIDSITKIHYIKVYRNPTANFTYTPTGGCSPLSVSFNSTSNLGDAPISSYNWSFQDGNSASNSSSVIHTYLSQGNFSPILLITDTNGCSSTISLGPISVTPSPSASFTTSSNRSTCADSLKVDFINGSTGINLTYLWEFGDNNNTTSNLRNPSHTYNDFGSYTVSLTVTDPSCTSKKTEVDYIRLRQPVSNFSLSDDTLCAGVPIALTNNSTDVDTYLWDFGDGTGSVSRLPNKIYSDSGTYVISLTVLAPGCSDFHVDTITIEKSIARFTVDTFSCNRFDSVKFVDQSYNAAQWIWKIQRKGASGNLFYFTDSTQNPVHDYGNHEGRFSDSLIIISPKGCRDTLFEADHRVYDTTEVLITDDNQIPYTLGFSGCIPDTMELNSTLFAPSQAGNFTFTWLLPDSQTYIGPNPPQNFIITDDSSRLVRVSVLSSEGCRATKTTLINLGFKIAPTVSVFPKRLCYGDTLTIVNTTPNDSLPNEIWYGIEAVDTALTASQIALSVKDTVRFTQFPDTGYFNLVIKQIYNTCDTTIIIDSAFYVKGPVISTQFSSNCVNRNLVNFQSVISGATRFYWDFGDTTDLDSINVAPSHTYDSLMKYVYNLTAYNDTNGCPAVVDSQVVDLTPVIPPIIRPSKSNFCLGDENLIWQNSLTRLDSIEWTVDGVPVSQKDSFIYVFNQKGVYNIGYKGKDQVGCEYERYRDFYVSKPEASFSYQLLGNCLPAEIRFTNTSAFDTTAAQNYFLLGGSDTLFAPATVFNYTTGGNKSITLYTENIFGCSDTVEGSGLFNLEAFDVDIRTLTNRNICQGRTILFKNNSSNLSNTFVWNFGDGDTLLSNNDSIYHTFDSVGNFNVTLRGVNGNGCIKSDSVLFRIEANPVAGFTADTIISTCYPLEVQFQDTSSGNVVDWFWKIDTNFSVLDSPQFIFQNVGKYDVSLIVKTPFGCTDTVSKSEYIQTNGPQADFSIDKNSGCVNELFTFTLDSSKNVDSYVWDFGDGNTQSGGSISTHTYRKIGKIYVSLILSDSSGKCTVAIRDSIQISDVLADFTMTSDTGCIPFNSTFISTSINANSLRWDFGLGQGFSSSQQQETVSYNAQGSYFIRLAITSAIGCIDTAIKKLDVFNRPVALVSGDTGMCFGQTVQLNASGGDSYLWSPDTFINHTTIPNPVVNPSTTTRYSVLVSNPSTCFDTASILVEVIQEPDSFLLKDSTLIIGENYQLNANAGRGYNYIWTPTDGLSCADCPNPIAMPLQNMIYYLEISDDFGCFTVRDTIEIKVEEKYSLDVPKAFSPNNDGINDIIYARGWGLKELIAFKIYNRFGELVFESTDFSVGWNGRYKGKDQNIETYIYTVEALTFGNKVLTKTGNISLLR